MIMKKTLIPMDNSIESFEYVSVLFVTIIVNGKKRILHNESITIH